MPNELDPLEDQWYAFIDKGQRFYIVAIDEDASTIEVQHFDSDLEEYSFDEWRELGVELSEAPENWDGALDVGELDDHGTEITDTNEEDWSEPQEDFRPAGQEKLTPDLEASVDEYDRVQLILGRGGKRRPNRHEYAYTGMFTCGDCGKRISATFKVKVLKESGRHATYSLYYCIGARKHHETCTQGLYTNSKLND